MRQMAQIIGDLNSLIWFVGGGVLTVFFLDIYKLNLYANDGLYSERNDFVLEFEYLKPVSKSTIIDASINELTKPDDVTSTEIKFWKKDFR